MNDAVYQNRKRFGYETRTEVKFEMKKIKSDVSKVAGFKSVNTFHHLNLTLY